MSRRRRFADNVLVTTLRRAKDHQVTDQAAALTYYAVLAAFPAMLVLVSLLGLTGDAQATVDKVLQLLGTFAPPDVVKVLRAPVESLATSSRAGVALVVGLAVALWSTSNYVSVMMRVTNLVDEVDEGRGFVRRTTLRLGLTVVLLVLAVATAALLFASGPLLTTVSEPLGLSDTFITVWSWVRWPLAAAAFVVGASLIYTYAPNAHKAFRIATFGGLAALVVWVVASVVFTVYVGTFASYQRTYGALAGAIVALIWLWLTNLALLLGAEMDAELARRRVGDPLPQDVPGADGGPQQAPA